MHCSRVTVGELSPILIVNWNYGGRSIICLTRGTRKDGSRYTYPDGKEHIVYLSCYIIVAVTSKVGGITNEA